MILDLTSSLFLFHHTSAMCSVYSAVSGERLALLDVEGHSAGEVKLLLAAQLGIPRFRQRFMDGSGRAIPEDEIFTSDSVKIQLMLLEFLEPDAVEDQRMMDASIDNDLGTLERCLQCPRDPKVIDKDGQTPLHNAAWNGNPEAMQLLLEAGAGATKDRRDGTPQGWTPLLLAAWNGHVDCVDLLIEAGVDGDMATLQNAGTPLYIAAEGGYLEMVRLLIKAGVDVNKAKSDNGTTPLLIAAARGHLQVLQLLIDAAADVNKATTDAGAAPLYLAAQEGHDHIVRSLLEAGRERNQASTETGGTPLFIAAQDGHVATVQLLIEAGVDINKALA